MKRALASNRAKVAITSANAERVEGTVTYADQATDLSISLNGSFQVERCPTK